MNRNSFEFGAEFALGTPEVIRLLHPQPQSGTVAAEPAEPRGHRRSDRHFLGHNPVKLWRVTPSCRAASLTERPSAGSTSSRRIAPGCVGQRPAPFFTARLVIIVGSRCHIVNCREFRCCAVRGMRASVEDFGFAA